MIINVHNRNETMAYNSNKIEGSALTPEQTASLFDNGTLPINDDYYRANGYAIGDYMKCPNMIGMYKTVLPQDVEEEMHNLLKWYHGQKKTMEVLARFHARYESIHPFQDSNGRTGRMILFRENLKYDQLSPFI